MDRLRQIAVLTELADRMRSNGNWCGETHLQKAVYLLQDLLGVPLGVDFILYKHGPYSFDLTELLTGMRADHQFEKEYVSPSYGPRLRSTESSRTLRSNFSVTLAKFNRQIDFVTNAVGTKGVAELEKLATAQYVTREQGASVTPEDRASRIHELKPHVTQQEALAAVQEFDQLASEASKIRLSDPYTSVNEQI